MSKKGIYWPFFVVLIAVLALLIIFITFIGEVKEKTEEKSIKDICKMSVQQNAKIRLKSIEFSPEINCETVPVEIKSGKEKEIKYGIAKTMADCWDQFGEGKLNLFGDDGTYCFVCSKVDFKKKEMKLKGFNEYLIRTTIPGKRISFADYFTGQKTAEAVKVLEKLPPEKIAELENEELDLSKSYGTFFVYAKGKDSMETLAKHLAGETTAGKIGAIGGVAVGAGAVVAALIIGTPVGWAVAIGAGVVALVEAVSFWLSPDNHPEWAAAVLFREYTPEAIKALGCTEVPPKEG